MTITAEQKTLLDAKIPIDVISTREGGGRKLSYLEGWYVINRLNEVFGQGNWSYNTETMTCVFNGPVDRNGKPTHWANYVAKVTLIAGGAVFSDFGYGDGSDSTYPGKAHELAVKEAVTDGIKRCAKNLGHSMGLALYDKSRENVDDAPTPQVESKTGAGNSKRAAAVKSKSSEGAAIDPSPAAPAAGGAPSRGTTLAAKAKDRNDVNMLLSAVAKSVISKKLFADLPAVKAYMSAQYGTDTKEKLTDPQAVELLNYLDNLNVNGVTANA